MTCTYLSQPVGLGKIVRTAVSVKTRWRCVMLTLANVHSVAANTGSCLHKMSYTLNKSSLLPETSHLIGVVLGARLVGELSKHCYIST